jgi:hypothetical protein
MIAVDAVEVAIVHIVHMIAVLNGRVSAARTMMVPMVFMLFAFAFCRIFIFAHTNS